jgi:serine/threonine-protein kinase
MENRRILESWKEISAHLGRETRTCQKWEHELGLPIHRLDGMPRARVYAYTDELDRWLEEKLGESATGSSEGATAPRTFRSLWLVSGAAIILLAGIFIGRLLIGHSKSVPSLPVFASTIKVEPGHWLEGLGFAQEMERLTRTAFVISNDGRFIVYSGISENPGPQVKSQIYLRKMDQIDAAPVAGTEGGVSPFLSPDDHWIGFWADGELKKVPATGGVPTTLCEAAMPFGADWGPENTIVYSSGRDIGLSRISGDGGNPGVLTIPDKATEYGHRLPHWLPDGSGVLFTIMRHKWDLQPRLALLDLRTGKSHAVMEDAADGRCLSTGHMIFLRQGTLMAVAFDLGRLEARGQAVPIVMNVMQALNVPNSWYNTAAGQYSVSNSGWLAYTLGGIVPDQETSLVRVDYKGNVQRVAKFRAAFFSPRFSPDGQQIVYGTIGKEWRAWVYDLKRATASPLTREGWVQFPIWTPDGRRLVFGWTKAGTENLYWQSADGSSPIERLTTSEYWQYPGSFTPDGSILAFVEDHPETRENILLLDMKSRRTTPFLNSKASEGWPEFSTDGHWLAYCSDESGRFEVWVRPFPGPGGRWQISMEGGRYPVWSKDGKQLFYRQGDQFWVADVRTDSGFSAGKPRLLFEKAGFQVGSPIRGWDLWPDGRGFLMVSVDERKPERVTETILVQNWFEELKRLVPAGKK